MSQEPMTAEQLQLFEFLATSVHTEITIPPRPSIFTVIGDPQHGDVMVYVNDATVAPAGWQVACREGWHYQCGPDFAKEQQEANSKAPEYVFVPKANLPFNPDDTTVRDTPAIGEAFVFTKEERGIDPIVRFFAYDHLPPHLQDVSRIFHDAAVSVVRAVPRSPERTVALRKLLEAKDAAVRAKVSP